MGVTVDGQLTAKRSSQRLGSMITRRLFLSALAAGPRKPNFVIFLADAMRYGDPDCYGSPDVPTPHIDVLALGGTRLRMGKSPARCVALRGRRF